MKKLILGLIVCLGVTSAVSAFARPVRTSNPYAYAEKATLHYGQEQSDWDQAKVSQCNQRLTAGGGLFLACAGKTRILGPGGGGDFYVDYRCEFSFSKELARVYLEKSKTCQ